MKRGKALVVASCAAGLLTGCAHAPLDEPSDPLEPVNRAVFSFNRSADKYVLKPVAKGYQKVTPIVAQQGVTNFFNNLDEPRTIVNDLLQLKVTQAAADTGRFLLNSTAGFAGLMDVATDAGLPRNREDFGQTLGKYGVGEGWYLMLPLLGPTTNRDLVGRLVDSPAQLGSYVPLTENLALTGGELLDDRSRLLGSESLVENSFDPYIFVRSAYLQTRLDRVYDGAPPRELMFGKDE